MLNAANFSLSYMLYLGGWGEYYRYFNLKLLFGLGPALYFFVQSLLKPGFSWQSRYFMHFIPVCLEFLYHRSSWFESGVIGILQVPSTIYQYLYIGVQYAGLTSLCLYAIFTLGVARNYFRQLEFNFDKADRKQIKWLANSVISLILFFALWYSIRGTDVFFFRGAYRSYYYFPMFTLLSAQMLWLGFRAYSWKPGKIAEIKSLGVKERIVALASDDQAYEEVMQQLHHLMVDQQLFLHPDLNLKTFSKAAGLPQRTVSKAINQSRGYNFQRFVNQYRIAAFKNLIQQPNAKQLTILAHAYASGFASKSTFNVVFKNSTGMTPRQYLKQCQESQSTKSPES